MSRQRTLTFLSILGANLLLCTSSFSEGQSPHARLLFTGDILLGREVPREITLKNGQSPWSHMGSLFKEADWVMGNFEGSIGSHSQCRGKDPTLCFAIKPSTIEYLQQADFTAVSLENNHSADLGEMAKKNTRRLLMDRGIAALDFVHSPGFLKLNNKIIAFIAVTNVPGQDGKKITIHSHELRQKIRLAKSLSNWVIISIHWGVELSDWPNSKQKELAKWLIQQGADLIIGHHPHIIQNPECLLGRPVFYSLGNHVFDQKYLETKKGLIADCHIDSNRLSCSSIRTKIPNNSAFPKVQQSFNYAMNQAISTCIVHERKPLEIDGFAIRPRLVEKQFMDGDIVLEGKKGKKIYWTVGARHLLSLSKGKFIKGSSEKDFLFTLEDHFSDMDEEGSPRPYVYEVGVKGLIARWRGSALAWPLVDARLFNKTYLCALHRKDAFITLKKDTQGTRTAVYTWNGFGFSGVENRDLNQQCENVFN